MLLNLHQNNYLPVLSFIGHTGFINIIDFASTLIQRHTYSGPANKRRCIIVGLTLVHRLRRWTKVKPTLIQRPGDNTSVTMTHPSKQDMLIQCCANVGPALYKWSHHLIIVCSPFVRVILLLSANKSDASALATFKCVRELFIA